MVSHPSRIAWPINRISVHKSGFILLSYFMMILGRYPLLLCNWSNSTATSLRLRMVLRCQHCLFTDQFNLVPSSAAQMVCRLQIPIIGGYLRIIRIIRAMTGLWLRVAVGPRNSNTLLLEPRSRPATDRRHKPRFDSFVIV